MPLSNSPHAHEYVQVTHSCLVDILHILCEKVLVLWLNDNRGRYGSNEVIFAATTYIRVWIIFPVLSLGFRQPPHLPPPPFSHHTPGDLMINIT